MHAGQRPAGVLPGLVDLTAHPQLPFSVRFANDRSVVQDDETWLR